MESEKHLGGVNYPTWEGMILVTKRKHLKHTAAVQQPALPTVGQQQREYSYLECNCCINVRAGRVTEIFTLESRLRSVGSGNVLANATPLTHIMSIHKLDLLVRILDHAKIFLMSYGSIKIM